MATLLGSCPTASSATFAGVSAVTFQIVTLLASGFTLSNVVLLGASAIGLDCKGPTAVKKGIGLPAAAAGVSSFTTSAMAISPSAPIIKQSEFFFERRNTRETGDGMGSLLKVLDGSGELCGEAYGGITSD